MVSVVNGYVCFSCCDEAKAKRGEDPRKKLGEIDDPSSPDQSAGPAGSKPAAPVDPARQDAVTFGGALASLNAASGTASARPSATVANQVNVLA